jgi:hypothetical protein
MTNLVLSVFALLYDFFNKSLKNGTAHYSDWRDLNFSIEVKHSNKMAQLKRANIPYLNLCISYSPWSLTTQLVPAEIFVENSTRFILDCLNYKYRCFAFNIRFTCAKICS